MNAVGSNVREGNKQPAEGKVRDCLEKLLALKSTGLERMQPRGLKMLSESFEFT